MRALCARRATRRLTSCKHSAANPLRNRVRTRLRAVCSELGVGGVLASHSGAQNWLDRRRQLGHHVSLRPCGFTSNFAPNAFNKFGPSSQEACPRTRECVVSACISVAAFRGAPATAKREREWKPEPAT